MQVIKAFLIVTLCLSFVSCDLFETRKTEEPIIEATSEDFPSSPEILMSNFTKAINAKSAQNYINCLTDSLYAPAFRFIPSNSSISVYPLLAGQWDVKAERRYFENLLLQVNASKNFSMIFSNDKLSRYSDSALYSAHYKLELYLKKTEIATTYEGDLQLVLYLDARSRWAIGRWTDINSAGLQCWSDLKGLFYQ